MTPNPQHKLETTILNLEKKLLHLTRVKRADFENMITDDFIEIGASGKIFGKEYVVNYFLKANGALNNLGISDFRLKSLSPSIVLVTYKAEKILDKGVERSLRSSVWEKNGADEWKICFHQGTPLAQNNERQ